jgi:hypothetical protein
VKGSGSHPVLSIVGLAATAAAGVVVLSLTVGGAADPAASPDAFVPCEQPLWTIPTAIPTEEWTPEWLSQWSEQGHQLANDVRRRTVERLAQDQTRLDSVPRGESIADDFTPVLDLDDALTMSQGIYAGVVTGQTLAAGTDDRGFTHYGLVSTLRDVDGRVQLVEQPTGVDCPNGYVSLSYVWGYETLEPGSAYVLLGSPSETVGGAISIPRAHIYLLGALNEIEPLNEIGATKLYSIRTLDDLRSRFESLHAGRQVQPRPTATPVPTPDPSILIDRERRLKEREIQELIDGWSGALGSYSPLPMIESDTVLPANELGFADALRKADAIALGRISSQVVSWGPDPAGGDLPKPWLWSSIQIPVGSNAITTIAESVAMDLDPARSPFIATANGQPHIRVGDTIVALVVRPPSTSDFYYAQYQVLPGYAFRVGEDGSLAPLEGRAMPPPVASLDELIAAFEQNRP